MKLIIDDLQVPEIAAFLDEHIQDLRSITPPESKHAVDLAGLRKPETTFWTLLIENRIAGCLVPALLVLGLNSGIFAASDAHSNPILVGAMKDAMWKGRLEGLIDIDTISDRKNVVGLGPMEHLRGEIILFDGKSYTSEILDDGKIKVTQTTKAKAPFFGYSRIKKWKRDALPDSIRTIKDIEAYFIGKKGMDSNSFMFKMELVAESGSLHVVNLPPGTKVKSPADAHTDMLKFDIQNREMILIGFFSTQHQSIFTHHDTYLHIHAISTRSDIMGHLDEIRIQPGKAWVSIPEG